MLFCVVIQGIAVGGDKGESPERNKEILADILFNWAIDRHF